MEPTNGSVVLERANAIKSKIEKLIESGMLAEAKAALDKYGEKMPNDVEALSMRAVIYMMEGQLESAQKLLNKGLENDSVNFDLLYNLAYINELNGRYEEAVEIYSKANTAADTEESRHNIFQAIERIRNINDSLKLKVKRKIVFFVKKGMENFLYDIINGLSEGYWTRKIIVEDLRQIDSGMDWADICWFEWCDELIAYGSKLQIAEGKKIICRLHSYEAFTQQIYNVNWEVVNRVIFVAEHIRDFVLGKQTGLKFERTSVIPNGLNLDKLAYKKRERGFKIAYAGYINYKKGPMLLLHTFKAIYDADNRYRLYIAGAYQDYRDELYFHQMIQEFGIQNNVFYEGWQDDLDSWLEDKNYILCSSILESQNISVMQAMSKGIKPLVHNFVGAKGIYPKKYVWNTINEAVDMILNKEYNSEEYSSFIKDNYSLDRVTANINDLVGSLAAESDRFNSEAYWNNRLNSKFDIEGVGYLGLGTIFNKFMYQIRVEILDHCLRNLFGDLKSKDVLELGPGIGMFTQYFYEKEPKSFSAIDIAEKSVAELNKKFGNYTFIKGDISDSSLFENKKYDLIFAADVLLHLTDEDKYLQTIENIGNVISDNGYFITFDPITVIGTNSISPHVVIRDINYVSEVLEMRELEVKAVLPSAFFMNYPFDKKILRNKENVVDEVFLFIQQIYSSNGISESAKKELGEWLVTEEKDCLIRNKFGTSQKMLIIGRKSAKLNAPKFEIQDVWDSSSVEKEITSIITKISRNKELTESGIFRKFEKDIDSIKNVYIELEDKTKNPLVTVGIINFNGKKYLKKCIDSFINQSYGNIEILLIDDVSTDGSKEMIIEYEKTYKNIKGIYHDINSGGASKGIQDVIENANGKYFQWIASDDYVNKHTVERFVSYLENNPEKDYVYSDYNIVNEEDIKTGEWNYQVYPYLVVIQQIFNSSLGLIPMNCMYRSDFFKRNKINWLIYKNNDFSCDTLNSLQFIKYNWNYGKIDSKEINYRIHSSNLSHNLRKRIVSLVSIFDYIIENYSEEHYLPQIKWQLVENREQYKNLALAQFYYDQIQKHISLESIPEYAKGGANKEELIKCCIAFYEEGSRHLNAGFEQGSPYQDALLQLKEKYSKYYEQYKKVAAEGENLYV